ncbi:hypothetical protein [Modicisalibacter xianhensis]|uniref:hypothetical protein n=1 Tax=Modicisalibacter xianhensis TaxID=442341 RepID=UPI001062713C|nr:hypothetical protein [Halomonas xianhensis]
MNENQKTIAILSAIVLFMMLIFPPFALHYSTGAMANVGYSFILDPPRNGAAVNISTLLVQWFFVVSIGGIAYRLSKDQAG